MERIEEIETEEEVFKNRLYVRKYLRELLTRQEMSQNSKVELARKRIREKQAALLEKKAATILPLTK